MLFQCYISIISLEGIIEFIYSIILSIVVICMRLTMIYELNNKYYMLKSLKNYDVENNKLING